MPGSPDQRDPPAPFRFVGAEASDRSWFSNLSMGASYEVAVSSLVVEGEPDASEALPQGDARCVKCLRSDCLIRPRRSRWKVSYLIDSRPRLYRTLCRFSKFDLVRWLT